MRLDQEVYPAERTAKRGLGHLIPCCLCLDCQTGSYSHQQEAGGRELHERRRALNCRDAALSDTKGSNKLTYVCPNSRVLYWAFHMRGQRYKQETLWPTFRCRS
jgi:hypothetical protein